MLMNTIKSLLNLLTCYSLFGLPVIIQTLTFPLGANLTGSEVLKVEVYDHEKVGKNRRVLKLLLAI